MKQLKMNLRNTTSINLFGKYRMQKLFCFLLLSLFVLLNPSCKDPCDDTNCLNGGFCDDGFCECPDGYSGSSCQIKEQEPCENINCLNGGTCKNGNCDCRPGYSGIYCQTYDSCHNINCKNGGTCKSGKCDCPTGYDGTYCQNEKIPISVKITRIDIENFSLTTESGAQADANSLPDIYFKVLRNDTHIGTSCYIENANPNDSNAITSNCSSMPIHINSPKSNNVTIRIRAYDYDSSGDDEYLGGYFFDFENDDFPSTRTVQNSNSWHRLKVKLHLEWIF